MKKVYLASLLMVPLLVLGASLASAKGGNAQGGSDSGNGQAGTGQSSMGVQTTEQNSVNNQGEATQVRTTEQNVVQEMRNGSPTSQGSMQSGNNMEDATQTMMMIAERNQGEGDQIRNRVQAQLETHQAVEGNIAQLQERNKFTRFFVGPDYGLIKESEQLLEQNRVRIQELTQIKNQLRNDADKNQLQEQIRIMEQEQTRLENQLQDDAEGFSLFGWMFQWGA